ncbi:MAG: hypothetical protein DRI24_24445 [Deltaproteobacteria bacterium]|nr:MAG: hypothetical protein DRI24_24445 [Deltaproteobacteria bacterium]
MPSISQCKYESLKTITGLTLSLKASQRANAKRDNQAKKKNNGISDADDHLYDHIDLLDDYAETLRDEMEACSNNDCVTIAISMVDAQPWPTWSPI